MQPATSTPTYSKLGKATGLTAFLLGIIYIITTIAGLLSLPSADVPIGDPYFTLMEILTLLIAPLMAVCMVAVHYHAEQDKRIYSMVAVGFMFIMAAITSCVHFSILALGRQTEFTDLPASSLFFSFKWPSVVYALDILAWDWFFALSMIFAAPVFRNGRLEKMVRVLMILSGCLSLAGLAGVPLENMQVRNIGIIGYGVIAPFVFLLIGIILGKPQHLIPGPEKESL